jgi:hypothetical protein
MGGYRPAQRERAASQGFEAAYDRLVTTAARVMPQAGSTKPDPEVIARGRRHPRAV